MADSGALSAILTVGISNDARSLLHAIEKGVGIGGSESSVSTNRPMNVEQKGLLSKIAAGVAIGNQINSTFHEFLRPIFQLLKAILVLFFIPFLPFITALIDAFTLVFPAIQKASEDAAAGIASVLSSLGLGPKGQPTDRNTEMTNRSSGIGFAAGGIGGGILAGAPGAVIGGLLGAYVFGKIAELGQAIGKMIGDIEFALAQDWEDFLTAWGIFFTVKVPTFFVNLVNAIKNGIDAAVLWLKGIPVKVQVFVKDLGDSIKNFVKGFTDWFTNLTDVELPKWLKEIQDAISDFPGKIVSLLKAGVETFLNAIILGINNFILMLKNLPIIGKFAQGLPLLQPVKLDTGGFITKSGLAEVHKGEHVVPAGGGMKGTGFVYSPTYNISGAIDGAGWKKLQEDHDRKFLARLHQYGNGGVRVFNA